MNRIILFVALVSLFGFSSCMMRKIQYVKDMSPDSLYTIKAAEVFKIQANDRLSISVHSKNIELAAPFNTDLGGYRLSLEQQVVNGINVENSFEKGYLVDNHGFIDFPVLGKVHVVGLSMLELEALLSKMIIEKNYISDPLVRVNLLNFKIIVMGAIQNRVISVPTGKITLLEAIVQTGGLQLNSNASKVKVIREQGGDRELLEVDLEKYNMFNSDAYYLKQNDIIYIEPKYKQISPGAQSVWQIASMAIGVLSLVLTSIVLVRK